MQRRTLLVGIGLFLLGGGTLFFFFRSMNQYSAQQAELKPGSEASALISSFEHALTNTLRAREGGEGEAASAPAWSETERKQLETVREIFRSKNDNDPRLDSELKGLSAEVKAQLRRDYAGQPMEARNERGTLVYLVLREMKPSEEEMVFLEQVLKEPPCMSLARCTEVSDRASGEQVHYEAGVAVSLDYPQLVALEMIERALTDPTRGIPPEVRERLIRMVTEVKHSSSVTLRMRAERILKPLSDARGTD